MRRQKTNDFANLSGLRRCGSKAFDILSAYCKTKGIETVTAKSAGRGDVAVALDAIRTAMGS